MFPGGFDTVPGAESIEALQIRAAAAANWLEALSKDIILVVGHGVSGRAMARHYKNQSYTLEFNRDARRTVNLANGETMQLYPPPVSRL